MTPDWIRTHHIKVHFWRWAGEGQNVGQAHYRAKSDCGLHQYLVKKTEKKSMEEPYPKCLNCIRMGDPP